MVVTSIYVLESVLDSSQSISNPDLLWNWCARKNGHTCHILICTIKKQTYKKKLAHMFTAHHHLTAGKEPIYWYCM